MVNLIKLFLFIITRIYPKAPTPKIVMEFQLDCFLICNKFVMGVNSPPINMKLNLMTVALPCWLFRTSI